MEEKLKKLSIKIKDLVGGSAPQSIYDSLTYFATKQEDYFKYLGPHNFIKLLFYIYSIKTTKNFDLGDKMINNLSFIRLVNTEGTNTVETCSYCDGVGVVNCDECDGTGSIEDIQGHYYDDTIECGTCRGKAFSTCPNCDGDGEIELKRFYDFYIEDIVTWDRHISNMCELREGDNLSVFSVQEFDNLRNEYITLFIKGDSAPLDIQKDEYYCTQMTTEPELRFLTGMRIKMFGLKNNINHLLHQ
jgi:hypothetical protein